MSAAPAGWWRRHGASVALACVTLAVGLTLGLTAPTTSPVDVPWPAPSGAAPATHRGP
ncbi:hypothetical protein [Cellulomonas sp.]|uniref:hypothetical protein n=1 Tax=Cellulomonas sp. TaxID=40001 RepID=UPI001B2183A6|nr:hypothetical protein [Cellulomonas sp.]MBO9553674.1 hypothetical protein [Cellulomonas sp.]